MSAPPLTGQIALSSTPQQLDPTNAASNCKAFVIKAPAVNKAAAELGGSSVGAATGHFVDPGEFYTYERLSQNGQPNYEGRLSDFWAVGTSGDFLSWLAFQ